MFIKNNIRNNMILWGEGGIDARSNGRRVGVNNGQGSGDNVRLKVVRYCWLSVSSTNKPLSRLQSFHNCFTINNN